MRALILASALLLVACGDSASAPGPGGVSMGEAEALDQAAEMLDSQRLPPGSLDDDTAPPTPAATSS